MRKILKYTSLIPFIMPLFIWKKAKWGNVSKIIAISMYFSIVIFLISSNETEKSEEVFDSKATTENNISGNNSESVEIFNMVEDTKEDIDLKEDLVILTEPIDTIIGKDIGYVRNIYKGGVSNSNSGRDNYFIDMNDFELYAEANSNDVIDYIQISIPKLLCDAEKGLSDNYIHSIVKSSGLILEDLGPKIKSNIEKGTVYYDEYKPLTRITVFCSDLENPPNMKLNYTVST